MDDISNIEIRLVDEYDPKYGIVIDGEYYIKVNLPDSRLSELTYNGEGCWVKVSEGACFDHDNDAVGCYEGELANDSIYYPDLTCGKVVPFRMNGKYRSTVPFDWLFENYGESHRSEFIEKMLRG